MPYLTFTAFTFVAAYRSTFWTRLVGSRPRDAAFRRFPGPGVYVRTDPLTAAFPDADIYHRHIAATLPAFVVFTMGLVTRAG